MAITKICEPAPGIANNDFQTSASIVSQDIVNKDDSTTENILQPQTTQPALLIEEHTNQLNRDNNVEAEFPIEDDDSSKSSVAKMPPTKTPLGQANECRRKKNFLFTDKYTNKENTVPSKASIAAIDKSKKRKAVGMPLPSMKSCLSKPPDDNVDVEFQKQNNNSSKDGDGEQSS